MTPDTPHIARLVDNVSRLLSELKTLREEIDQLREENEKLKKELESKTSDLKDFQNKNKLTNIVGSINSGENDAEELRSRIDENIQELEECIALLSK